MNFILLTFFSLSEKNFLQILKFQKFFVQSNDRPQNRNIATIQATADCSLKNRPALRLDSRLVCKYEVLAVIGKGSFSQVITIHYILIFLFGKLILFNLAKKIFLFVCL